MKTSTRLLLVALVAFTTLTGCGGGDWKVGTEPWFAVEPGDSIYHESGARHAMQTNEQPLLAIWLWTSHLDSEVVVVRD
jgi:quercetin dioxygenase-like cupin family protein